MKPTYEELENMLLEKESRLNFLFSNMPSAFVYAKVIYENDKAIDFEFIEVNNAYTETTGLENVINRRISEVVPGIVESDPGMFEIVGRVAATGIAEQVEYYVEAMDKWFSTKIFSPKKGYFISINDDISGSKHLENDLRTLKENAEESDRLKSMLLANMSHEIRSPMTGILGYSKLLRRKNVSDEKRENYLDFIEQEGKRLLNIVSDIVDISKIDSILATIKIDSCNINALIDGLYLKYSLALLGPDVEIVSNKGLEDIDSNIETDSNRLVQILTNLIGNAIKFTTVGFVEFGYIKENNELKFYVKDSGPGIRVEDKQLIFERFSQGEQHDVKEPGTGLGLSIAKDLTELLGGKIWFESEINIGTTFFVSIPYVKAVQETETISETETSSDHSDDCITPDLDKEDLTILVAEDEYIIFLYLKELLSKYSCNVMHALNGKEAIKILEQNTSIDLILMDINMPEMNGYEALKEIRKINKEIPIVAQSGLVMSDDVKKIFKSGFDDYIPKPISEFFLITILNKHLKEGIKSKSKIIR